jgi:hypothetical protein
MSIPTHPPIGNVTPYFRGLVPYAPRGDAITLGVLSPLLPLQGMAFWVKVLRMIAPPLKIRSVFDCHGRFRGGASTSSGKEIDCPKWPQVTRRERSELLRKFRKEQRLDRRRHKLKVRETWNAEMVADKENYLHALDPREDSQLPRFPVNPEDEAEAYENYLFDNMMLYDKDSADLLFDFRSSLQVVSSPPNQLGELGEEQRRQRTEDLWTGLRRVYFGEKEPASSHSGRELTHEEVIGNLRREIAEIEERLRLRRPPDSDRPILHIPRDDDRDGPPPSVAHTNVNPDANSGVIVAFVTESGPPFPSDRAPSMSDADPSNHGLDGPEGMDGSSSNAIDLYNVTPQMKLDGFSPRELVYGPREIITQPIRKLVLLSKRILRKIMVAKESLFKFGTFVPKNDREAE